MSDVMKDATNWATMPVPGAETHEEQQKLFDAMPLAELADTWRALQQVGLRDKTAGTWAAFHYFDALPHHRPDRALDLILEILRRETDIPVLLQLGDKFTPALLYAHGAVLIDRLEREAAANPRLRWLLGSVIWWTEDDNLEARLAATACHRPRSRRSGLHRMVVRRRIGTATGWRCAIMTRSCASKTPSARWLSSGKC
jgi:hypothetical protein